MKIQEVTITRVYTGTKETKYGVKPTVAIKTVEYGDKWLSTFKVVPAVMDGWGEGTKVTLDVEVTDKFINFKMPDGASADMEIRVSKLESAVFGATSTPRAESKTETIQLEDNEPKGLDDFDF